DKIVLCSYHFAKSKDSEIQKIPWDLVAIDEAHRLRNVYRKDNKIARAILDVIGNRPKVLLTATPLQNSLMELYGLVSFIDPHLFGSEDFFRSQFARRASEMGNIEFNNLRARIQPIFQRTLRRQVLEYIRFTNRIPITQGFMPSDEELRLYEAVSSYLQRQDAYALPAGQRTLMTLVLRKILASSSFAIAKTLGRLVNRLEAEQSQVEDEINEAIEKELEDDYELLGETKVEWNEGEKLSDTTAKQKEQIIKAIKQESEELRQYKTLAESITNNAKGDALLIALSTGFQKAAEIGAPHKALIFTESRRTQSYLKELLIANEYSGEVVTLSGTNNNPDSLRVYHDWLKRNEGKDVVTGSKSADIRSAIVEEFRDRVSIMIATESGAEGINLQFCSLVVNYDLPWNPQRVEQRIGRCHRYGQKHDVVVINFLNRKNEADQRVFELLSEKLRLFSGVFGASDEVLGALESGVDFEKRINNIYQSCRTNDEIKTAFDQLQMELEEQIKVRMQDARTKLMENFDEDVRARLHSNYDLTVQQVNRFEDWLWRLTIQELAGCATYDGNSYTFRLNKLPDGIEDTTIPLGGYRLITHKNGTEEHHYRIGHPLAEYLLAQAKNRPLPGKEVLFKYSQNEGKISLLENLIGQSGWLCLSLLTIHALEKEEHLIFCGLDENGNVVSCPVNTLHNHAGYNRL
ncbi:MAG: SNF2-related protein, partial [Waddliaceae bacterium]